MSMSAAGVRFEYDTYLPAAVFEQITELPEYYPTRTELGILEILMRRSPGVADRRSIAQHVWDNEADAFGSNTIDVHLARLRSSAECEGFYELFSGAILGLGPYAAEDAERVVEQLVLESRDRGEAFRMDAARDPPPERRRRVLTEVETVLAEYTLQQERELDLLEVVAGRWPLARAGRPVGCDRGCH